MIEFPYFNIWHCFNWLTSYYVSIILKISTNFLELEDFIIQNIKDIKLINSLCNNSPKILADINYRDNMSSNILPDMNYLDNIILPV